MLDVLLDALLDALKIFPFILLIYVLMEIIENARNKEKIEKALTGGFAPVFSGLLGVVPECGFSVMCSKLYDKGMIRTGTLIAAFLSTGDEGLIVLISGGAPIDKILLMVGIKTVYAIIMGEVINVLLRRLDNKHICPEENSCIECGEKHDKFWDKYLLHPLSHSAKTFVYILIINIVFGLIIYFIGTERLEAFMSGSLYVHPIVAALVGLIPNCGASILITESFLKGALSFGGLMAGLASNAGIGLLILLKERKNFKRALMIAAILFVLGVLLGYACIFI